MAESVIKIIENSIREGWDKPALTDIATNTTYTYCEVAVRISYIHSLFEELGIKKGDKVAICDKNSCNWVISLLAVVTYKAIAVPLLPDYSDKQLVMLCDHCGAKFMIASNRVSHLWDDRECPMFLLDISDLLTMTPSIETDTLEQRTFDRYRQRYPDGFTLADLYYEAEHLDDVMLLSYTSGSTGNPKGVVLSFRSMLSNCLFAKNAVPIGKFSRFFVTLPMAHMYGFVMDVLFGLSISAHMHIFTKIPVPQLLKESLSWVKPHWICCVPKVLEKFIDSDPIYSKDVNVLKEALGGEVYEVMMGGASLSKEKEDLLRSMGFPYTIGYGMTESGPMITFSDWKEHRPGSCGKAVPRMEVRILSDDPANIPGEVVAKGDNLMVEYYHNADATAHTIDAEGWLHTGDMGVMDADGFVYLRGRIKNMLLGSNGQNIYPEEAEEQIVHYTIVDECVIVQRDKALVALVYVSDETLRLHGITRGDVEKMLQEIVDVANMNLPRYCQIKYAEQNMAEFEKTPKKNIRRFLYN